MAAKSDHQGDLLGDAAPTRLFAPHETVRDVPVHEIALFCLQRGTGRLRGRERQFLMRVARGGDRRLTPSDGAKLTELLRRLTRS